MLRHCLGVLCVIPLALINATSLGAHDQLVVESHLDKTVKHQIQKAEFIFCSSDLIEKFPNLLEAMYELKESDFPSFIKKYKLDLANKIVALEVEAKELDKKLHQLNAEKDKVDIPSLANKLGADFKWLSYSSLIFFDKKSALQKTPELKDFLSRFATDKERSQLQEVWRGRSGAIPKRYYEYTLNLPAINKAETEFTEIKEIVKEHESKRWNLHQQLLKLKSLRNELDHSVTYKDSYLGLKNMTLYLDREKKSAFVLEGDVAAVATDALSGIEICANRKHAPRENIPFLSFSREECERLFEEIPRMAYGAAAAVMKERAALNISKAQLLEMIEHEHREALKDVADWKAVGALDPEQEKSFITSLEISFGKEKKLLAETKALTVELVETLAFGTNRSFEYAVKEGPTGLEIYPVLQDISYEGDGIQYLGKATFLSSAPILVLDRRLIDMGSFSQELAQSPHTPEGKGLPRGYVSYKLLILPLIGRLKEEFCSKLL